MRVALYARKAIALNPRFARAWSSLGLTLEKQGRTEEAVTAYRKALALNSSEKSARVHLMKLGTTPYGLRMSEVEQDSERRHATITLTSWRFPRPLRIDRAHEEFLRYSEFGGRPSRARKTR